MLLYIKNMVCSRCKMVVRSELEKLGLRPVEISLGEVLLEEKELTTSDLNSVSEALNKFGFELLDDRRSKLINQVKSFIIESIHHQSGQQKKNYSELLSRHLHHDYSHLSNLFSQVEGITIEQYIINQKIEKVKELLIYGELSLSDISVELGYSSTAHLSGQFKRVTGLTPTDFRRMGRQNRKSLDDIGNP